MAKSLTAERAASPSRRSSLWTGTRRMRSAGAGAATRAPGTERPSSPQWTIIWASTTWTQKNCPPGRKHLMNCMKHLDKCRVSSENVSLFIHVRNQLGILWAGRDETEKAQGFLETAESIYQRYMKENGSPPTDMSEYFCSEENQLTHQERTKKFELAYTHTLYYLAQVYQYLGENERAANYCYSTLQRQLQLKQFNPMEWALNAATLSQYYITKGHYMEGRHCLAAATVVSGLAGEVPSEAAAQESEAESDRREQLRQKRSDIRKIFTTEKTPSESPNTSAKPDDNIGELDTDRQDELRRARRREEEEEGRKQTLLFGS
ncbi:KIF1-binding-like protein [Oryzias melastigma]|uniref:KIF-binding protein n=1 Tax=Oryzias melastigma TaxID=30732 RepID=A0A834FG61_ORYME|nr:KIF1-binding-like protein [Oryzias melastigma]